MHTNALADYIELEQGYRKAKTQAARYAVDNNITDYRMLHKLLYRSFRERSR
jgi:hypothetical protein